MISDEMVEAACRAMWSVWPGDDLGPEWSESLRQKMRAALAAADALRPDPRPSEAEVRADLRWAYGRFGHSSLADATESGIAVLQHFDLLRDPDPRPPSPERVEEPRG